MSTVLVLFKTTNIFKNGMLLALLRRAIDKQWLTSLTASVCCATALISKLIKKDSALHIASQTISADNTRN